MHEIWHRYRSGGGLANNWSVCGLYIILYISCTSGVGQVVRDGWDSGACDTSVGYSRAKFESQINYADLFPCHN